MPATRTHLPQPNQERRTSNIVSLEEARRHRDEQEERRLEQLVIERWAGSEEDEP